MDIADVARRTGVPASTLRYYANKGLLRSLASHGQRRQFPPDTPERLALIALGQAAGFSLDEVAAMLDEQRVDRELLLAKADEIDRRIKRLQAMSKGLRHAAQCPEENHLQCPTFQRLMRVSASQGRRGGLSSRATRGTAGPCGS
ncbi:helix-turn-helix domain-containing protein [Pseudomonas sp. CCOS 191]|uniref:helix-turn-helix domain-containing protein n=1 Tax=Pseudomonas sp. CCOS 191 TaxID=1649877 RepID=UPI0018E6791C|nr:helix-turn-helix domain-containing protein [Pseudomonas sp. CCOS 191]MBI6951245.1 helix-turn-helix domain-containing protein [Pseudomonas sp. CCOS 191]